ncbi:Rho guanine nucleotide exchange factor 35 [Batrachochytrium dendrobatidis]
MDRTNPKQVDSTVDKASLLASSSHLMGLEKLDNTTDPLLENALKSTTQTINKFNSSIVPMDTASQVTENLQQEKSTLDITALCSTQSNLNVHNLKVETVSSLVPPNLSNPNTSVCSIPCTEPGPTSTLKPSKSVVAYLRGNEIARTSPLLSQFDVPSNQQRAQYAIAEYSPQLSDEIQIVFGDRIVVSRNFKDEWVLGKNETTGLIGVFPKKCLGLDVCSQSNSSTLQPALKSIHLTRLGISSGFAGDLSLGRCSISKTPIQMQGESDPSHSNLKPYNNDVGVLRKYNRHELPRLDQMTKPRVLTQKQKWMVLIGSFVFLLIIVSVGLNVKATKML